MLVGADQAAPAEAAADQAEPSLLASPPSDEIQDGAMYPATEVRRRIDRAYAAARRLFQERLVVERERLEDEFKAQRDELVAETVRTTADLLRKGSRP